MKNCCFGKGNIAIVFRLGCHEKSYVQIFRNLEFFLKFQDIRVDDEFEEILTDFFRKHSLFNMMLKQFSFSS